MAINIDNANRPSTSWVSYKNGNYIVHLNLDDGTKIRVNDLTYFEADFPESMDVKITNCCNMNCQFCHENSTPNGKHGSILNNQFFKSLHPYTELAIGGGNVLEHPDLIPFLEEIKSYNLIPNITLNQQHFMENRDLVRYMINNKLIYGLGVSLTTVTDELIEALKEYPNTVLHVIAGIVSNESLMRLRYNNIKVLILGYKEVRRGKTLYEDTNNKNSINSKIKELHDNLPEIIKDNWFDVVSFDNLAIKQLDPHRLMTDEQWSEFYMGDDGLDGEMTSASMYVDLVEGEFARNSCAVDNRHRCENLTAVEMFKILKAECANK